MRKPEQHNYLGTLLATNEYMLTSNGDKSAPRLKVISMRNLFGSSKATCNVNFFKNKIKRNWLPKCKNLLSPTYNITCD